MLKIQADQVKEEIENVIDNIKDDQQTVIIENQGESIAAVISYEKLQQLEELEDAIDVAILKKAIEESTGEFYSLEEVMESRGLKISDLYEE